MIPPFGFKSEIYPLRHRFVYSTAFSMLQASTNSTICTIAKNYKSSTLPDTTFVNPHHASFDVETGAICAPMSILDKISLSLKFDLTEDAVLDGIQALKIMYMPIFTVFGEKLDSVDEKTTTTAAAVLELTKDATEEDITPAFGTKISQSAGSSDSIHPTSTVNFTEVFGTLNMTTNTAMEAVPWNNTVFNQALKYYTNKGAIRSMVGRQRWITLTQNNPHKSIYIKKFVPRAVRRILPYSFFGMMFHVPIDSDPEQPYYSGALTTAKPHAAIKMLVNYHEWNADHNQDMATT